MTPPAEIDVLRGGEALVALADDWRALVERCPSATVFQTWEWHAAWWRALGAAETDCEPVVVRLRASTRTLALLPLARVAVGGATVLRFLTSPVADYHDAIVDDRAPPALVDWLAAALADGLVPADALELDELRRESLLGPAFLRRELGLDLQPSSRCPYLAAPAQRRLPGQYTRKARKLEAMGGALTTDHLVAPCDIHPGLAGFFDMHAGQWRERPDVAGSFDDERNRRFFAALVETAGARGWLLFSRLRSGGRVLAHDFSLRYRRVLSTYRAAFDREQSQHSPGHLLLGRIVEGAADLDLDEIDLLRGEYPYKYLYASGERRNLRVRTSGSNVALAREDGIVARSWGRPKTPTCRPG